mmetsp:Transcript_28915/g.73843  ORF Transcript_28915/g.73843 Transcript_28915/m.73843 type:complete len:213 (+) Transcript_28915:831-1469(+)
MPARLHHQRAAVRPADGGGARLCGRWQGPGQQGSAPAAAPPVQHAVHRGGRRPAARAARHPLRAGPGPAHPPGHGGRAGRARAPPAPAGQAAERPQRADVRRAERAARGEGAVQAVQPGDARHAVAAWARGPGAPGLCARHSLGCNGGHGAYGLCEVPANASRGARGAGCTATGHPARDAAGCAGQPLGGGGHRRVARDGGLHAAAGGIYCG